MVYDEEAPYTTHDPPSIHMCDTLVAAGSSRRRRGPVGKNSDREPNEAIVVVLPAADHTPGGTVCHYLDTQADSHPRCAPRQALLLDLGAEMGTNDQNVTIGNEAVFTKVPWHGRRLDRDGSAAAGARTCRDR